MLKFQQSPKIDQRLYLEDTDKNLPEKLNPHTRYAFFSTIATGGKSLIKSCKDLHLGRAICYKTLRPEFADDPIESMRLLREARISAMLQHPNTVPTYEIGRDNRGHYYFTMKLVHGYTLRELLDYRERYDLSQLIEVLIQVARALGYAHSHGVIHRDVKPENILVGPFGEVLLLDWGLAKVWNKEGDTSEDDKKIEEKDATAGLTGQGKLQGTVMYMSPQQVDRMPDIDSRTDLYSFGTVLYEVLTGRTPFTGDRVHMLLDQIRSEVPIKPSAIEGCKVPDLLSELAVSCLKKDPDDRPESAEQVVRALQENWNYHS